MGGGGQGLSRRWTPCSRSWPLAAPSPARLDERIHYLVDLLERRRPRRGDSGGLEALVREVGGKGVIIKGRLKLTSPNRAQTGHLAAVRIATHVALELVAGRAHADLHHVDLPREARVLSPLLVCTCVFAVGVRLALGQCFAAALFVRGARVEGDEVAAQARLLADRTVGQRRAEGRQI